MVIATVVNICKSLLLGKKKAQSIYSQATMKQKWLQKRTSNKNLGLTLDI